MHISVHYNSRQNTIFLSTERENLYTPLLTKLNDIKETFPSDFKIDMDVDESTNTINGISLNTSSKFHYTYKTLDAEEICHWIHMTLFMDEEDSVPIKPHSTIDDSTETSPLITISVNPNEVIDLDE